MADPLHPTATVIELFDPEIHPPPTGKHLLLINPGGTLIIGFWQKGCLAWGLKPKIPVSVKQREIQRLSALIDKNTQREQQPSTNNL